MSEYKLKANELRIGNLLKRNGIVVTIDGRSIFDIWDDDGIVKLGYEPIEITENLLLKMGFTKDGLFKNEYVFTLGKFFFSFNNHMIYLINGYEGDVLNYVGSEITDGDNYIKHIHQVQNVYYSLTNEELTIL
jgi:hypothetical protein